MHYSYVTSTLRSAVIVAISVSLFIAASHTASLDDDNNRNVPLAIITSNAVELTPAKVGRAVSADLLAQTTVAAIADNVEKVVLISLPKLSFARLAYDATYNKRHDTEFLSHALESMRGVLYPAVSHVDRLVASLSGSGMTTLHVKKADDVKEVELASTSRSIQIRIGEGVSLHDSDAIFGRVVKMLNSTGHSFSIIYTADAPDEWVSGIPAASAANIPESNVHEEALLRYKRQAQSRPRQNIKPKAAPRVGADPSLVDSNYTLIFYGANCFEFYATQFNVSVSNTTTKAYANATIPPKFRNATITDANCTSVNVPREPFNVTLNYGEVGNFSSLSVTFNVQMNNPWEWIVKTITLDYQTKIDGVNDGMAKLSPGYLTAQVLFSYHCNNPDAIVLTDKDRGLKASILFGTIQAQAYDIADYKFGWQCDCVGFFTPAIWAALFVSAIYLLIIALAIGMLVNLETMDRFEDPKGQPLKIQSSG